VGKRLVKYNPSVAPMLLKSPKSDITNFYHDIHAFVIRTLEVLHRFLAFLNLFWSQVMHIHLLSQFIPLPGQWPFHRQEVAALSGAQVMLLALVYVATRFRAGRIRLVFSTDPADLGCFRPMCLHALNGHVDKLGIGWDGWHI